MTRPMYEGPPNLHQIVESPARLSGLEPLDIGHSVEITSLGMTVPDQPPAAEDVVSILVGPYEGRTASGAPYPYHRTPDVSAVRILDVSALPITVLQAGAETPVKANFVSMHWEEPSSSSPRPMFTPLFPGVEYAAKDPSGGNVAATYNVSEEGALTVTRSSDAPERAADVHVAGATPNASLYVQRPARGTVKRGTAAVHNTARLGQGVTRLDDDGHLVVTPGAFNFVDADGARASLTVQRAFLLTFAKPGLFEAYTADTLTSRQRIKTEGRRTVADFTTIGKDENTGGQPPVV